MNETTALFYRKAINKNILKVMELDKRIFDGTWNIAIKEQRDLLLQNIGFAMVQLKKANEEI